MITAASESARNNTVANGGGGQMRQKILAEGLLRGLPALNPFAPSGDGDAG